MKETVIVVGAGLAGLSCARHLTRAGLECRVIEASDGVGGRMRTDVHEGFRLDRGFQVLQTAYPEVRRELDLEALDLHPFERGAIVMSGGRRLRMIDPRRRPMAIFSTLFNGIGTFADRLKVLRLGRHLSSTAAEVSDADGTTMSYLRDGCGFSSDFIERFLRPWFAGVFLEDDLATSARFFRFLFRIFAEGEASLPSHGMAAIPEQLAAGLPRDAVRLGCRVESIDTDRVRLADGDIVSARAVVLAVEGPEAERLSGGLCRTPIHRSTVTYHFAAPESPLEEPILVLAGDRDGPINNLCVPSDVAPGYALAGTSLVSASMVGGVERDAEALLEDVRRQLRSWFGGVVDRWTLLRRDAIRSALPFRAPDSAAAVGPTARLADRLFVAGDHRVSPSIQGALESGRRAAEALQAALLSG